VEVGDPQWVYAWRLQAEVETKPLTLNLKPEALNLQPTSFPES